MTGGLQRLVVTFKPGGLQVRTLYRPTSGSGPPTRALARREITTLVRTGLQDALEALEGDVDVVGISGFTTREDIVLCTAKGNAALDEHKIIQKGA